MIELRLFPSGETNSGSNTDTSTVTTNFPPGIRRPIHSAAEKTSSLTKLDLNPEVLFLETRTRCFYKDLMRVAAAY